MNGDGVYTLETIGEQLSLYIAREQERDDKVETLYKTVVIGNGKPSHVSEIARHGDWINNGNKFIWLVISALVGQFVVSSCSFMVMVIILLAQGGVLK